MSCFRSKTLTFNLHEYKEVIMSSKTKLLFVTVGVTVTLSALAFFESFMVAPGQMFQSGSQMFAMPPPPQQQPCTCICK